MRRILTVMVMAAAITSARAIRHEVRLTYYHAVAAQTNGQPTVTADGSIINMGKLKRGTLKWCAVSRDLLCHYPYGTKIHIEGMGWYEVHDTTAARIKRTVDILMPASKKGETREAVIIYKKAKR